ncbi:tyrosine-protein phosphatase [Persicirhabdus sediminis]|uniref:Tyrosine-protein phosphatase n=1 Tax=Persicirhabdus sediminis TaxID=454144 RepID=A0A8J7MDJ6_9BACT|nr:tyrosine-protein phosphatase [Persicirhabdus sediminis]MBK1790657.1 tyrosine-protein phosphatase [Persicirhabdus sediminis]
MKKQAITITLHVLLSAIALVSAGCNKKAESSAETKPSPSRIIKLDGQSNFRDLGGYQTSDGKTVKWRQVFRSGELPKLSDGDVAKLEELEIRTVINFLTKAEITQRGEDRLPDGTNTVALTMEAGDLGELAAVVLEARTTGDFSAVPPELNPDLHRRLMEEAKQQYAALLREAIAPTNRPLVFHCSHGIHRTGTGAAILLSALGVPWETVRKDYLISNQARAEENTKRLGQLKALHAKNLSIPIEDVDSTNMEAFYLLEGAYIDAALEAAVEKYGSMEAYIRDGLGITDAELNELRQQLLE